MAYEKVVANWLSDKNIAPVKIFERKNLEESVEGDELVTSCKLLKLVKDNIPKNFSDLEVNVLYRPRTPIFPFCDMYYKTIDRDLICLQVSFANTETRSVKGSSFTSFLKSLKGLEVKNIKLKYCPQPLLANVSKVTFDQKFKSVYDINELQTSIWKFPSTYV
jgi:hypothetical protein